MIIFVNALSARLGGGQTYLRHLLEKLPQNGDKIFIISPDDLELPKERGDIERLIIPSIIITNPFVRSAWEYFIQPSLLKKLEANILFCPGGSVTGRVPRGCRIVTTFQNMMPFDNVQRKKYSLGYMRFRNWLLEKKLLGSMMRSDLVIFISEYAKSVIEKKSDGRIRRSVVIPHGLNPDFRKRPSIQLPKANWLPSAEYILYVSILDIYKSQIEVLEAFALLKSSWSAGNLPKLVFVGPEYAPYGIRVRESIIKLGLNDDVIVKSAVSNKDLPSVYQNALINIFASQTENCPFILLEALASGTPVLVSRSPPMPEFGDNAVVYFNPTDPSDLAEKLKELIQDNEFRQILGEKALQRSFDFNWDITAQKTWQAIKNLV